MKLKRFLFYFLSVPFLLIGCEDQVRNQTGDGCPFAPATSNFDAGENVTDSCPGCYLSFTHRDQEYHFEMVDMDLGTRVSCTEERCGNVYYSYHIEPLFEFNFTRARSFDELYNSLDVRTELLSLDSLEFGEFHQVRSAFSIKNYCEETFYPSHEEDTLTSYNRIEQIELHDDRSGEDYITQDFLATGRFETRILVNGSPETIEGNYKLKIRLFREK